MGRGVWPQSHTCSETKHQPVSLVPGRMTCTRVLVKNPRHIYEYTCSNQYYPFGYFEKFNLPGKKFELPREH